MRRVTFDPGDLGADDAAWFAAWMARAHTATTRALATAATGDAELDEDVWGDFKRWLLKTVFHGKCAYCEGKFDAQTHGAADHYRPKGRVRARRNGKLEYVVRGRTAHRGYYWLAHSWTNLVPCCDRCNSGSGKGDQFPVAKTQVFDPSELHDYTDVDELDDTEGPLLLHPWRDDPEEHLAFGLEGVIAPRDGSPRGEATIEVCKLSRAELHEERKEHQEYARTATYSAVTQVDPSRNFEAAMAEVYEKYAGPTSRYSAAARVAIELALRAAIERMGRALDG